MGDFCGFGCPNDAQTPCWVGLWLGNEEVLKEGIITSVEAPQSGTAARSETHP